MALDLSSRAMIAHLSIRGIWSAVAEDERVTAEVAKQHGVSSDIGRYLKKVCDPKKIASLKDFNAKRAALYNMHRAKTLAWDDKGGRLLPAPEYFNYMADIDTAKVAMMTAYEVFLNELPAIKAKFQTDPETAGLYRDEDWPDVNELRARVDVRVRIQPLADPNHFLVKLGDEVEANIKAGIQKDVFSKLSAGLGDLVGRLKDVVTDAQERMAGYQVNAEGKTVKTFRDSAITNVRDMVADARKLNVIGDPTLNTLLNEIEAQLCTKDPQALRDNFILRKKAVNDAGSLAAKLANIENVLCSQGEAA